MPIDSTSCLQLCNIPGNGQTITMYSVGLLLMHVCMRAKSYLTLLGPPQTVTHQAPLSTGFSRQEYWSGLPFPSPGDLPNPGIEPTSPLPPALAGRIFYH